MLPWLIISLILEIAALIAWDFAQAMGNYPLTSFAIFAALLGLMAIFFPALLIKLWDCKPIPAGYLRTRLEDFCRSHHFTCRDILLWNLFDGRLITAGVVGFVTRCRYILISPVLLQILDEKEVESVVAHEIGHVKNHHMIYYTFFLLGYVVVAYGVLELLAYEMLSQSIFVLMIVSGATDVNSIVSLLLTLVPLGFFIIYFRMFFGYFSRNFERQSDLHALKLMGTGDGIVNALEKIARVKILDLFEHSSKRHMTAEEVYSLLKEEGQDIGLATVYRVLTQFGQAGLLMRHHFDSDKAVFEFNQGEHHDHLVCLQSGRVEEFFDAEIEKRQKKVAESRGFAIHDHSLQIYVDCTKSPCPYRPKK